MTVSVPERKAQELVRLMLASAEATEVLRTYAVEHGGRFTIFGSFARGDITPASDFDVLVAFPAPSERAARLYAETVCRSVRLTPDVHLASEASDALLARVERDGVLLP